MRQCKPACHRGSFRRELEASVAKPLSLRSTPCWGPLYKGGEPQSQPSLDPRSVILLETQPSLFFSACSQHNDSRCYFLTPQIFQNTTGKCRCVILSPSCQNQKKQQPSKNCKKLEIGQIAMEQSCFISGVKESNVIYNRKSTQK